MSLWPPHSTYRPRVELLAPFFSLTSEIITLLRFDILHQSVEIRLVRISLHCGVGYGKAGVGAVEDIVESFLRQIFYRGLQSGSIYMADGFNLHEYKTAFVFSERHDTTFVDRLGGIGHYLCHVDDVDLTETLALPAGSWGELNEKLCGAGSGYDSPFSESIRRREK